MTHNTSDNHSGGEGDWEKKLDELCARHIGLSMLEPYVYTIVKNFIRTEKSKSYQEGVEAERRKLEARIRMVEASMQVAAVGIEGTASYDEEATKWYKAGMHGAYAYFLGLLTPTNTV